MYYNRDLCVDVIIDIRKQPPVVDDDFTTVRNLNRSKMRLYFEILLILLVQNGMVISATQSPNVVIIIADDLGWNDVSYHGSDQIQTPNIDLLAYSGVALSRYYSHDVCTPSRSALLSGKYAHKIGMQGYPLTMSEDRAIPLNVTILPQYLKSAGYRTHLVGKWHVGASRNEYLPTARGFDTHFGHRGGYLDYYEYTLEELFSTGKVSGMCLYRNLTAAWDVEGYITDVYTSEAKSVIENHDISSPLFLMVAHNAPHSSDGGAPLQAPPEVVRQLRYIESPQRRMYAAMVKKLDDSVGDIVTSLNDKGILNNTIIVFISDNGGVTTGNSQNYASNYPLRGLKWTPFEGGVRVVGLLWSMSLRNTDNYWNGYMHVSDWVPTLLKAVDIPIPLDTDGVNQWDNINSNTKSNRTTMYEIDDYIGFASITYGEYKLISGNVTKDFSTYQGHDLRGIIGKPPSYRQAIMNSKMYSVLNSIGRKFNMSVRNRMILDCDTTLTSVCFPENDILCLYNIMEDPCETTDLSQDFPELLSEMKLLLEAEVAKIIPRVVPLYREPLSAPRYHNFTWAPWKESLDT